MRRLLTATLAAVTATTALTGLSGTANGAAPGEVVSTLSVAQTPSWHVGQAAKSPLGQITLAPASPIAGEQVVFTSRVPGGKRVVTLQRKAGKRWTKVTSGKSSAKGAVSLHASLSASATVRLLAPAKKKAGKRVKKYAGSPKQVSLTRQAGSLSMDTPVYVQEKTNTSAKFTPARLDRPVVLQGMVNGAWVEVARSVQNSAGVATFNVTGAVPGTYQYRAVALPKAGARQSVTSTRTVKILKNEVTVSPDVRPLTPGEIDSLAEAAPDGSSLTFGAGSAQPELQSGQNPVPSTVRPSAQRCPRPDHRCDDRSRRHLDGHH